MGTDELRIIGYYQTTAHGRDERLYPFFFEQPSVLREENRQHAQCRSRNGNDGFSGAADT